MLERIEPAECAGGLLQSGAWASVKEAFGWNAHAFSYNGRSILVLTRRLGPFGGMAYVPHAPEEKMDTRFFAVFAAALRKALPPDVLFIRFDLPWEDASGPGRPFFKAVSDIQPPDSVLLDLSDDEETILAGMKKKTRYNIGLASKKGVEIIEGAREDLDAWYAMYEQTATRDRISIHERAYYSHVWDCLSRSSTHDPRLLLAKAEGQLVSGIFLVLEKDRRATYLYGASTDEYRNYMPNYLLQWEGIRLAKAAGCAEYDFFGIPPADDPAHPMHGLYRFKTGFGGRIVHMSGCYDYPCRPVAWAAFSLVERARAFYYKVLRKKMG